MIKTMQVVICDICRLETKKASDPIYYSEVKIEPLEFEGIKIHELGRKEEFHLCQACTRNLRNFIEIPF